MAKVRMNIELADNGVILRDPDNSDVVTVAKIGEYGHSENRDDVYKAVGRQLMDALEAQDVPQSKKLYGYKIEANVQLVTKPLGEF